MGGNRMFTRGGFARPGASMAYHTGGWRSLKPVHEPRLAPCAQACPAAENAQAYLAAFAAGREREAWELLVAANPLPGITGRVCPHPCENACNRGQLDQSVAIHSVERHLGDRALAEGWSLPLAGRPEGEPVAIVGAGPAGLSCAWHLLQQGHRVDLYEADSEAGGLCLSAIPGYRLPKSVVRGEVERLLGLPGLRFFPRQRLGGDLSLDELKADHAAVFLGVGAQQGRDWSVDGATPGDLHQGLDLLKEWQAVGQLPEAGSVAVIGGGNTAVDLCRIFRFAGAKKVYLVTHSGLPQAGVPDPMRALPRELAEAQAEGVEVLSHQGVTRLVLRGERVIGLELVKMQKLPDAQGRLQRRAFAGTETILNVDMVVPAVGQQLADDGLGLGRSVGGLLQVDAGGRLGDTRVWSGGDAIGGSGTVAEALGHGRRAALDILRCLDDKGTVSTMSAERTLADFSALNPVYFAPAARHKSGLLELPERDAETEINQGLPAAAALAEAQRCLSCGECMACDNCYTYCPDVAVLKTEEAASDGSHYVFDMDYCKGCGLCANECPTGYIQMRPEDE